MKTDNKLSLITIGLNLLIVFMLPLVIWKLDSKNKSNIDTLFTSTQQLNKSVENLEKLISEKDIPTFSNEFKNVNDNILLAKDLLKDDNNILNQNFSTLGEELDKIVKTLKEMKEVQIQSVENVVNIEDRLISKIDNSFLLINEYLNKYNNLNKTIKRIEAKLNELNEGIKNTTVNNNKVLDFTLTLQGVMQTPSGYIAYVSGEDKSKTESVTVKSKINGWEVVEIKSKSILIRKNGIEEEIFIDQMK